MSFQRLDVSQHLFLGESFKRARRRTPPHPLLLSFCICPYDSSNPHSGAQLRNTTLLGIWLHALLPFKGAFLAYRIQTSSLESVQQLNTVLGGSRVFDPVAQAVFIELGQLYTRRLGFVQSCGSQE